MTRGLRLVATMGTVVTIDVRTALPAAEMRTALDRAEQVLHRAELMFSTYRPGSWVSRLRRGEVGTDELPAEVSRVLALCGQVAELTDGAFSARWRSDRTPDPTGLVKGWAAGRAGRLLSALGAVDHCVNAAGDLALAGRPAPGHGWRVGIADPRAPGALLGAVGSVDGFPVGAGGRGWAVATSGIAERGRHVVDPRTGRPATGLLSATVVGPDPALADGLATALLAAGPAAAELLDRWRPAGWRGCLLTDSGQLVDPDGLLSPPAPASSAHGDNPSVGSRG